MEDQTHSVTVTQGLKNRYSTQVTDASEFGMESLTIQQGEFSVLDDCTDGGNYSPQEWPLQLPAEDSLTVGALEYQSEIVGDEPVGVRIGLSVSGYAKKGDQVQIFFEDNGEFLGMFRQSSDLECLINQEYSPGCDLSSYERPEYPLVEYLLITLPQDITG